MYFLKFSLVKTCLLLTFYLEKCFKFIKQFKHLESIYKYESSIKD